MFTITVEKRNPQWKAKTLRRNGYVPASVYGGALPASVSLQIPLMTAQQLLRTCSEGDALTLEVAGETYPVILKERTVSILNEAIEQISFQAVKA